MFKNLLLSFLLFSCPLSAAEEIAVAPGVRYEHRATEHPLSIHILRVDPKQASISSVRALHDGLGLEALSSIAGRTGAIAAINGGFFASKGTFDGLAQFMLKIDGDWIAETKKPRSAIGWNKEGTTFLFDRVNLAINLSIAGQEFPISGLNRRRHEKEALLFTAPFHRSTLTSQTGTEILIDQNKVLEVMKGSGDNIIPHTGYIYSDADKSAVDISKIAAGQEALVTFSVQPQLDSSKTAAWNAIDTIVGGTPLLIQNGKHIPDFEAEKVRTPFLNDRLPRTAIGTTQAGEVILVVVDGRNPFISLGLTMKELQSLMASLGCHNALNLDGGGSSALALNGAIVSFPSGDEADEDADLDDKKERRISDAIIIR